MSQPAPYTPTHAFLSDEAQASWFPGQQLDVEFNNVKTSVGQIETNLALIQRDDGALANGSVTFNSLSTTLQTAGLSPLTSWATGIRYSVPQCVIQNTSLYQCAIGHTSSSFAADLAAGDWVLLANLALLSGTSTVAANLVAAGPTTGAAASPNFRGLVAADLPTIATVNGITFPAAPYVAGDILYAGTTTSAARLADVATGSVLTSGGIGVAPAWSTSPTLAAATLSALTLNGTATITPAQGTAQAINTLQVVTGAISAPLNIQHISFDQGTAGSNFSEGWYFQHEFGGGACTGGRQGLTMQLTQNAATNSSNTNRQYVAFAPFVTANSGDGGGAGTEKGFYYAIGSFTWIKAAATHIVQAQAGEFDILVESGASLLEKYGLKVVQIAADAVQGSSNDACFVALSQAGGTAPGWKVLIQGGDGVVGQQPLAATGTVLKFASAQTVDGGIDLRTNVTCSTFAFQSNAFRVDGSGNITAPTLAATSSIKSSSPTAGVGYATGAGGAVTQASSKATATPAINTMCGAVTMNNAALAAATIVSFVLTNSSIAATDVLVLNHISGGTIGSYTLNAQAAAGSATINVRNNTAGSLSEAIVIQFAVIKGVNA